MDDDSTSGPGGGVIVSGQLLVAPGDRAGYLAGCEEVVRQARQAPGCLDFAISADLLDPGRINVLERWESRAAVEAFRGAGTPEEQAAVLLGASVVEFDVAGERRLA